MLTINTRHISLNKLLFYILLKKEKTRMLLMLIFIKYLKKF